MPDTVQFAENPRTPKQRHPRQQVSSSCVQLADDNGGKILNISESGLALQAVRSLTDGPLLKMRFQLSRSQNWIETEGRIVWISASGRTVGVEFVGLPHEVRDRIKKWISLTLRPSNALSEGRGQPKDVLTGREAVSPASIPEYRAADLFGENPKRHVIAEDPGLFPPDAKPISQGFTTKGAKRAVAATIVFVLAFGAGVAIGVLSLHNRGRASESLINLRERISAYFRSRPAAEVPTPTLSSGRQSVPSPGHTPSDAPETESLAGPSSASDARPAPGVDDPQVPRKADIALVPGPVRRDGEDPIHPQSVGGVSQREDNGQAELALARKYLRESSAPGYGPKAADLLWRAVQKGNSEAEVQLADLYLRGEVVPRNCNQARILLRAAHHATDSGVTPNSLKLPEDGCKELPKDMPAQAR